MELLYFTDISQLQYILDNKPELLEYMIPISSDMNIATELDRLGISFIDEWDYLNAEDVEKNFHNACKLADSWWKEMDVSISNEDISNFHIARQHLRWPFETCLNTQTIYSRILDSLNVTSISGFFLPFNAYLPAENPQSLSILQALKSISQAVLFSMAETRNISLKSLGVVPPQKKKSRKWSAKYKPSILDVNHRSFKQKGERVVLLLDSRMRQTERIELERQFNNDSTWRVVRLTTLEYLTIRAYSSKEIKFELENKLSEFRDILKKAQATYNGKYPEIFRNSYLNFQFEQIWLDLLSGSKFGDLFSAILATLNPSLIIIGYDPYIIERTIEGVAHKQGIPVAGLVHGGLGITEGFNGLLGDADIELVWGSQDIKQLIKFDENSNRLKTVGSLQYDKKYNEMDNTENHYSVKSMKDKRRILKLPINFPVVLIITASINVGHAAPTANASLHRKTWIELMELALRRPDITYLIKTHPSWDHYEFYHSLIKNGPVNLIIIEDVGLDQLLSVCDVVLLVNYCTTAALDAMLKNIPVVFLRTAIYQTESRKDILMEHGAISVSTVLELELVIDNILKDNIYRNSVLLDAEITLAQVLGERGMIPTLERMMIEFEKIALPLDNKKDYEKLSILEKKIFSKLAVVAESLSIDIDESVFQCEWQTILDILHSEFPESKDMIQRIFIAVMFAIGANVGNSAMISRLTKICCQGIDVEYDLSSKTIRTLRLEAYLFAIRRYTDEREWFKVRNIVWRTLRDLPFQAIHSNIFRHFFIKCHIPNNRITLSVANFLDRIKWNISKFTIANSVRRRV